MANTARVTLAENASADGSAFEWVGGPGIFMHEGTYGGGNVDLEVRSPNGTWLTAVTTTAAGVTYFNLPPGQIRAGITTATAVYAYAARIGVG